MLMNIEDYLEILVGLSTVDNDNLKFNINPSDLKLLSSLGRQVNGNIGLTDRQHELAKTKLIEYNTQFKENNFNNLGQDLNNLRLPLRKIDRTKSITLCNKEYYDLFGKENTLMIAIRFPYSNKMVKYINFIHELQDKKEYDKQTKTHFIKFTEYNVLQIIEKFQDANFTIEDALEKIYIDIKKFNDNPKDFCPGIYKYELKNIHENCKSYAQKLLGKPSNNNLALYYDRRDTLGLKYFDESDLDTSLNMLPNIAKLIAKNQSKQVYIKKTTCSLQELINSILLLKRLPLIFILKKKFENLDLIDIITALKSKINIEDISVLFRLDNLSPENIEFNKNVKQLKLNNPINKNTKVIFLNEDKIPKPLLACNIQPNTTVCFDTFRRYKTIKTFYETSDLIIHYDDSPILWKFKDITTL